MVVPSPAPSLTKPELRAAMRRARKAYVAALSAAERAALEDALSRTLRPLILAASIVALYSPMGSEIDPRLAIRFAEAPAAAFPTFADRESPMRFCLGECTEDCPVGGLQPPHLAAPVTPDLILIPLLAIDAHGNRLGQGGGHYDRALPALKAKGATLIGIGWTMQRLDFALRPDHWDVALDGFASPQGLEMFR